MTQISLREGIKDLQIHQAIYGERDDAHRLLAKSGTEKEPFAALTGFTDRPPGDAPPSLLWSPLLRGFAFDNFYVCARTFLDPDASRGGMVRTHALILPLDFIGQIADLRPILALLPSEIEEFSSPLEAIEWAPTPTPIKLVLTREFANVTEKLLESGAKPVVLLGQNGFEEIVTSLWAQLWPGARRQLEFGLQFQPQEWNKGRINLWVTPLALRARWSDFPTLEIADAPFTPLSATMQSQFSGAQGFLLGLPAGEPLQRLMNDLPLEPQSLGILKHIERCAQYLALEKPSFEEILAAARFVINWAPSSQEGISVKNPLLRRLFDRLPSESIGAVTALRNFDVGAFENGEVLIGQAMNSWAKSHLCDVASATEIAAVWAEVLSELRESASQVAWATAFRRAGEHALKSWPSGAAQAVWQWWQQQPALVTALDAFLPSAAGVDLVRHCPLRLSPNVATPLCNLAARRRWLPLHAATTAASLAPQEAIAIHLQVDKTSTFFDALRVLEARLGAEAVVEGALKSQDERLEQMAGESCVQNTALLTPLEVENPSWRRIWRHAIQKGHPTWQGIAEPQRTLEQLLDLVADGQSVEIELLKPLSISSFADLTGYARRASLWPILSESVRVGFVTATAEGWFGRFLEAGANADFVLEKPLETAVLDSRRLDRHLFPSRDVSRVGAALLLFERFPGLSEAQMQHFLERWTQGRALAQSEAQLLGQIIARRRWKSAASTLLGNTGRGRADFKPALRECLGLFGIWESIRAKLILQSGYSTTVTADDCGNYGTKLQLTFMSVALKTTTSGRELKGAYLSFLIGDRTKRAGGKPCKLFVLVGAVKSARKSCSKLCTTNLAATQS